MTADRPAPVDLLGRTISRLRRVRVDPARSAALSMIEIDRAGTVVGVRPEDGAPLAADDLDVRGALALTAGAEPHTHLDKADVWDELQPGYGDLAFGIRAWQAHAATLDEADFVRRGLGIAAELVANGVTAIRTHAEIFPTGGSDADALKSVRAMVAVRRALEGVCDVQVVVLPKNDISDDVIRAALDAGADLVGGSPHNTPDPDRELDRLLAIARERGTGIDIHADERLDPTSLTAARLARSVRASPLAGTVTAGHCTSLGLLDDDALAPIAAELANAGVGVIAAPITNLYLQGRDRPVATPRGITAVRRLRAAGVLVAGAGDNVRDPINPIGAADPFATAALLVSAAHLEIEEAWAAVTDDARRVMGLPRAGTRVGDVADLVIVDAPSLAAAVAGRIGDRLVLRRGRVVSDRRSTTRHLVPLG